MPVRIGTIELIGLQDIRTVDARNLVQQRGPGQSGSVAQDLGREPVTVIMEGLLLGDDPHAALEELRQAQTDARPLAFAADAIAGAELTDVLIQDLRVNQLSGHVGRFWFHLEVREYTEPPEPAGASLGAVEDGLDADAAAWTDGAVGAAGVLADPSSLADAVGANPGILEHLSAGDISGALQQGVGALTGGDFAGVLRTLGGVDPGKLVSVIQDLASADSFGDFMEKLAGEGIDLLEELTGVDLGAAASLVKAIAGGSDFLAKLRDVAARAEDVAATIGAFDLSFGASALLKKTGTTPRDVIGKIDELVLAVDALFKTDTVHALGDLARDLGIGGALAAAFSGLIAALEQIDRWLVDLEQPLAKAAQIAGAVHPFSSALTALGEAASKGDYAAKADITAFLGGAQQVLGVVDHILGGLPRYAEEIVPVRDALTALKTTCQGLRAQVGGQGGTP